jgi:hypothetical protein
MAARESKIAAALGEIAQGQPLTPDAVVEVATDPDHVLHDSFEWDDGAAGHSYRVWQARHLIRGVKIVTPEGQRTSRFVSVKIGTNRQYEDIRIVVQDADKWTAVLTDMAQRFGEYETTLNGLVSMAQTEKRGETAQEIQQRVTRLRNRLEEAAQLPL